MKLFRILAIVALASPFAMIHAHCGSCASDKAHDKAAKSECTKDKAACAKDKASCDKDGKSCDDKKACGDKKCE